jgi:mannose-6-phosphate isomerase-like protein (cupin superfamily)
MRVAHYKEIAPDPVGEEGASGITEGRGSLVQRGKEVPFSKGDVIFIPPGEEHQLKNSSKETLEFICLIPNDKVRRG